MRKYRFIASALTLGLAIAAIVGGAFSAADAQSVGSGNTGGSVAFVRDAGHAGYFEIESGRMALERSQHSGVRGYASQTVKDASEMVNRVKFINNANISASMPSGPSDEQQAELNRLANLNGPDFDREYMRSQIEVSEFLARICRSYGATGESETLRVYVAKSATDYDKQLEQAHIVAGALH